MTIKIVSIDDNPADSLLFKYVATEFSDIDDVINFKRSEETLAYLHQVDPKNFPHFIFIDLYLDNANGLEFVKAYMKENFPTQYPNTLLFVLSGGDLVRAKQITKRLDCISECIQKPLSVEKLRAICHKYKPTKPVLTQETTSASL